MKTLDEINRLLKQGEAIILTAGELKAEIRRAGTFPRVDVVTCATMGIMSGTRLTFSIPVSTPNTFVQARRCWINGIEGYPGPCPNERLGVLDCTLHCTSHRDNTYGGGHLLKDLLNGNPVAVEVEDDRGNRHLKHVTLKDIPVARVDGTRHCFRNYTAFVNSSKQNVRSIFAVRPLKGDFQQATFSGCGEWNPIQNDPDLQSIGVGSPILINGAPGIVTGLGTRSTKERPSLATSASLKEMEPYYTGGICTAMGPEVYCTIAIPIAVTSPNVKRNLMILDQEISLPVVDVMGRRVVGESNYGEVWKYDDAVVFQENRCLKCETCAVEKICPTKSFSNESGINIKLCIRCGTCAVHCQGSAFTPKPGFLHLGGQEVPVVCRLSDRVRAGSLAKRLKDEILEGRFPLKPMVFPFLE